MASVLTFNQRLNTLPREIIDQIYNLTLTLDAETKWPNCVSVDRSFRLPSVLQVSRQAHEKLLKTYYETNTFWVLSTALFLSRMRPEGQVREIREYVLRPKRPIQRAKAKSKKTWYTHVYLWKITPQPNALAKTSAWIAQVQFQGLAHEVNG